MADVSDNCPAVPNTGQQDSDGDLVGDACDSCPGVNDDGVDSDGDGVDDACDRCPGFNDFLPDTDGDCVADVSDNCPAVPNTGQQDSDGDTVGDACDDCPDDVNLGDSDGDGVDNACDNCPAVPNTGQEDSDGDDVGDVCDSCPDVSDDDVDSDGDGVDDACDRCPGFNDFLPDSDGDCVPDVSDNCPAVPNGAQADADGDDVGDACDGTGIEVCDDGGDNDGDGLADCEDPDCDESCALEDCPCWDGTQDQSLFPGQTLADVWQLSVSPGDPWDCFFSNNCETTEQNSEPKASASCRGVVSSNTPGQSPLFTTLVESSSNPAENLRCDLDFEANSYDERDMYPTRSLTVPNLSRPQFRGCVNDMIQFTGVTQGLVFGGGGEPGCGLPSP